MYTLIYSSDLAASLTRPHFFPPLSLTFLLYSSLLLFYSTLILVLPSHLLLHSSLCHSFMLLRLSLSPSASFFPSHSSSLTLSYSSLLYSFFLFIAPSFLQIHLFSLLPSFFLSCFVFNSSTFICYHSIPLSPFIFSILSISLSSPLP